MFERLRAAINAALDAATPAPDLRAVTAQMRAAVIDAHSSVQAMREGIERTGKHLALERRHLEDAERRGRLAAEIDDRETVEVAERFVVRHREKVQVLDRKLEAQRAELTLAERELGEMKAQLQEAQRRRPEAEATRRVEAAWRDLEAAGAQRPGADPGEQRLRREVDRMAREAEADAQLEALKRKMGKT